MLSTRQKNRLCIKMYTLIRWRFNIILHRHTILYVRSVIDVRANTHVPTIHNIINDGFTQRAGVLYYLYQNRARSEFQGEGWSQGYFERPFKKDCLMVVQLFFRARTSPYALIQRNIIISQQKTLWVYFLNVRAFVYRSHVWRTNKLLTGKIKPFSSPTVNNNNYNH